MRALERGWVHVAGTHLHPPDDPDGSRTIRRALPRAPVQVITLARWTEGLLLPPGNPRRIRTPEDLLRRGVRIVNQDTGAGSRAVFERWVRGAGIEPDRISGYDRELPSHFAVAEAVASGLADCGPGVLPVGQAYGLGFLPSLRRDRTMRRWPGLLLILLIGLVGGAQAGAPPVRGPLLVFAAASLTDAFGEVGSVLERENPGPRITFNLAASSALRTQILQGARADVFASADERNMQQVQDAGMLWTRPVTFVRNEPVVVVPAANPGGISSARDLARPGVKVVVAAPEVPIGAYTRQILASLSRDPSFGGTSPNGCCGTSQAKSSTSGPPWHGWPSGRPMPPSSTGPTSQASTGRGCG